MTRAEYEALDLAVRRGPGWTHGDAVELRQAREDLMHKRNEECSRRARWHATYNAALTGITLYEDSPVFPTLEAAAEECKRICTAHADALHGSIE